MPRFAKYEENDEPISGYRLVSFLGAGQFGEVWKALESTTGRLAAIKIIDLSHSNSALKELKAFNLVKNLNHPNLVPIFTACLKDKNGWEIPLFKADELRQRGGLRELVIAMGLCERSLASRLRELNPDGTDPADFRGIPVDELLGFMQGAAKGIDFLNKADHGLGTGDGPVVHCDIKPDNMMIVSGEVQIADCGVAVIITPDARQTKAAGSPAYSAPELTGNKPVPGTDQYALAISYYELRTGNLPFDETMGQLSIMLAHAEGRLDFSSPMISDGERKVLLWATAVRAKERYPTCRDMVKQLERAVFGFDPLEPGKIVRNGVVPIPPPAIPSMPEHSIPMAVVPPGDIRGTFLPDTEYVRENSNDAFDKVRGTIELDPEIANLIKGAAIPRPSPMAPPKTASDTASQPASELVETTIPEYPPTRPPDPAKPPTKTGSPANNPTLPADPTAKMAADDAEKNLPPWAQESLRLEREHGRSRIDSAGSFAMPPVRKPTKKRTDTRSIWSRIASLVRLFPAKPQDRGPSRQDLRWTVISGSPTSAPANGGTPIHQVFISYRRDDSADITGRMVDRLKVRFDRQVAFRDIDTIPLGYDFHTVINWALQRCQVMIVVIGPQWLTLCDEGGRVRIEDPSDTLRMEVEIGLSRGIPVIPVYVNRAPAPRAEQLPEPLKNLARRNGIAVRRDPDFDHDMERLIRGLQGIIAEEFD